MEKTFAQMHGLTLLVQLIINRYLLLAGVLLCFLMLGCEGSGGATILFESIDPRTGIKLVAATHQSRPGAEGWDFFISIKSASGTEIARSTLTSLDTPYDIGSGSMRVVSLSLDSKAQTVWLSFQNGKTISIPVVLWVNDVR